jgi:prepilin-type N-terminal cleavage/methylation domain-containing protein
MHFPTYTRSSAIRAGMTLIEVVAVVALTGILMIATTSVLRSLLRSDSNSTPTLPLESVKQLMARDLMNATEFKKLSNGFALRGAIALDEQLHSMHINAAVFYEVDRSHENPILWRRQNTGQSVVNSLESRTPITVGVFNVILDTNDFSESVAPLNSYEGWTPLPNKIRVLLLDANREVLSLETLLRESRPQASCCPQQEIHPTLLPSRCELSTC